MRRGGSDQDDAVARFEPAVAMDDEHRGQRPAFARLGLDLAQLAFGHAGIVFERHRAHRLAAREVTDQTDEAAHGAGTRGLFGEAFELGADVEIVLLDPDHRQPPVIGGNSATSSPAPTGASNSQSSWLTATRSVSRFRSASA